MMRALMMNDTLCQPNSTEPHWQVVDPIPRDGRIKLYDFFTHQEEYREVREILDAIVDGRLVLQRPSAPRVSVAAQNDPKLDKTLQDALENVRLIEGVQRKYNVSLAKAYELAKQDAQQLHPGLRFVSRATAYRYIRAKQNGQPLLRGDKNKGNRKPRYDERIYDLIVRTVNTLYLRPGSRWSMLDLVRYINDQAYSQGWLSDAQKISRELVRRCIYENSSVDPEVDRMDPKLVAAAKSIANNRILPTIPFERVEQDEAPRFSWRPVGLS